MEELLEIVAWYQLGIHDKPVSSQLIRLAPFHHDIELHEGLCCVVQVGLLNVDGYYDSLLALFDKGVEEGFIEGSARHIVVSAENAEELIRRMEENET